MTSGSGSTNVPHSTMQDPRVNLVKPSLTQLETVVVRTAATVQAGLSAKM